ncbi:phosphonate metabolism protein/1,5-bisphosphokinase (PRPP-forming) PhnN [Defluviimonas aestuarii]|uniref:phosphonate metabolism protein/1,5-bisphosphokinase (PRPP-forming) PhnN n=1 Tax=Albidovulum aestuarii TaxID=1130726 RepID=UPI00249B22BD|nr:phosphonate metabolism protein/1,5-bisphosphokinase (PRPP-forming) PhnN [Defluviimonas aestuarii]MDI3337880.1 phosphonate metabolism protein/1,5-bisphosphokinase (PRPP-forming) PhnN [Defluviimonas aestuarii]
MARFGQLVALVGPSGSGKDTLLAGLARACPDLHVARRTISRPASAETEPYESVIPEQFAALRADGAFALHWQAHGLFYGIRHRELVPLQDGRVVIFNGSRRALPGIIAYQPDVRVITVTVPPDLLAARLAARGREDADEIAARLKRTDLALAGHLTSGVVWNDGTPEEGIARLVELLQPVNA